jgi:hypothetical protein
MSVAHAVLDGVSLIQLFNRFLQRQFEAPPPFPEPMDTILRPELDRLQLPGPSPSSADPLASLPWSSPLRDSGDRPRVDALITELPSPALTCFNPKSEKFVGLTDALWGASALACHALYPGQPGYGSTMWVSLRGHLKKFDLGNLIVPLTVAPASVSPAMSISDFEKSFRRSFNAGMKSGAWLTEMKVLMDSGSRPRQGSSFFDVSNVGYFPTTGPFVDTWSQQSQTGMSCNGALALAAVTVYGKQKNARLTLRLPYSPHVFTRSDMATVFKAVQHYLLHIRRDRTVGDAIREIREAIA